MFFNSINIHIYIILIIIKWDNFIITFKGIFEFLFGLLVVVFGGFQWFVLVFLLLILIFILIIIHWNRFTASTGRSPLYISIIIN